MSRNHHLYWSRDTILYIFGHRHSLSFTFKCYLFSHLREYNTKWLHKRNDNDLHFVEDPFKTSKISSSLQFCFLFNLLNNTQSATHNIKLFKHFSFSFFMRFFIEIFGWDFSGLKCGHWNLFTSISSHL
jgi:hypothetical protein